MNYPIGSRVHVLLRINPRCTAVAVVESAAYWPTDSRAECFRRMKFRTETGREFRAHPDCIICDADTHEPQESAA